MPTKLACFASARGSAVYGLRNTCATEPTSAKQRIELGWQRFNEAVNYRRKPARAQYEITPEDMDAVDERVEVKLAPVVKAVQSLANELAGLKAGLAKRSTLDAAASQRARSTPRSRRPASIEDRAARYFDRRQAAKLQPFHGLSRCLFIELCRRVPYVLDEIEV